MYFSKIRLSGLKDVDLHIYDATPQDRFLLKGADGLDPPPVNVNMSAIAFEGSNFQNRRPTDREVVIRVGLNPVLAANERHSDLRDELYGLLSTSDPSEKIVMKLMDGANVIAQTDGWVKQIEAVMFTQDPEAQITIACPKPYFTAPNELELVTATTTPGGEGADPTTTISGPSSYNPVIDNPGNASTGFVMEIVWDDTFPAINIAKDSGFTNVVMAIGQSSGSTFIAGDLLIIDTRIGSRKVDRVRSGVTESMLKYLSPLSIWPQLQPGRNQFYIYPFFIHHWKSIRFRPQYWGV